MNKQDNRLALSVLATLIAALALIYTLIMYHRIIFAVAGMSVLFLITVYILTQNIIIFSTMKNKSLSVQIKGCLDDISMQLEAMNGAQSQIGKATYLYTKQAAQAVTTLEHNYIESQEALYKNLSSLSSTQNRAVKLLIKYDQNNTTKLIATLKDMRNHLSETMIHGFDQIQPNNIEVVTALEEIVAYLKSQPNVTDQALGLQLSNVAHELQSISSSIQNVQLPPQSIVQTVPTNPKSVQTDVIVEASSNSIQKESEADNTVTSVEPEQESLTTETASVKFETDTLIASAPSVEPEKEAPIAKSPSSTETKDANAMLSPDEIAALFAASEPSPKKDEKEEVFTPTFTVIGKSDSANAEETEEHNTTNHVPSATDSNPNKQLSPDEIAALFAAAEPAPKKEEHTL